MAKRCRRSCKQSCAQITALTVLWHKAATSLKSSHNKLPGGLTPF